MIRTLFCAGFAATLLTAASPAQTPGLSAFRPGPVFPQFSQIAPVESDIAVPADTTFRVAFDVADPAEPGALNRTLVSAARFIDMHVAAGIPADQIHLAVVVHGRAGFDVSKPGAYDRGRGGENANRDLVAALIEQGVQIHVCGQSAAAYAISPADLLPGVKMSLSAMTSHALLQQDGYTLNPF